MLLKDLKKSLDHYNNEKKKPELQNRGHQCKRAVHYVLCSWHLQ